VRKVITYLFHITITILVSYKYYQCESWLLAQFKYIFAVLFGYEKSYYISFSYYNYNSCFLQILSAGIILINIYINERQNYCVKTDINN